MNKSKQIIDWWLSEGCQSNDINGLLIQQGKLAGYSYYFAEHVGKQHTSFIMREHNRKVEFNADMQARIAQGEPKGASEVASFLMTAELRIQEKKAEIAYRDSKLLLDQINGIIGSMTMRLSYLKKEAEGARFQDNMNQTQGSH